MTRPSLAKIDDDTALRDAYEPRELARYRFDIPLRAPCHEPRLADEDAQADCIHRLGELDCHRSRRFPQLDEERDGVV